MVQLRGALLEERQRGQGLEWELEQLSTAAGHSAAELLEAREAAAAERNAAAVLAREKAQLQGKVRAGRPSIGHPI